jgi:hypothetical protein
MPTSKLNILVKSKNNIKNTKKHILRLYNLPFLFTFKAPSKKTSAFMHKVIFFIKARVHPNGVPHSVSFFLRLFTNIILG